MINLNKKFKTHTIICSAIQMGNDWNISIYGGDKPHIGAIALGIPRPSLQDENKISSSVSILTITGHKEDVIVQKAAKILASTLNSTVVVSCGIHIDDISFNDIQDLDLFISNLIDELISKIL
jgi:gallate decarboxylase subunit D